jgi:hypothetical protein
MQMRVFLKTGRARYWRSLFPPRTAANFARQNLGRRPWPPSGRAKDGRQQFAIGREGCIAREQQDRKDMPANTRP